MARHEDQLINSHGVAIEDDVQAEGTVCGLKVLGDVTNRDFERDAPSIRCGRCEEILGLTPQ